MKIGTLLSASLGAISLLAGGVAVYVTGTKYRAMSELTEARQRLQIVRAFSEVPRLFVIERGFSTTSLSLDNPRDPARQAQVEKLRARTNEARDRALDLRRKFGQGFSDGAQLGAAIDKLAGELATLQQRIDAAYDLSKDERRRLTRSIVADNAVFNGRVYEVLDGQVRELARVEGNAYRNAQYAAVAWSARDLAGQSSSLHKDLIGRSAAPDAAEQVMLVRAQARVDQVLGTLMPLRGAPGTPENVSKALEQVKALYIDRFMEVQRTLLADAIAGKFGNDQDAFYKVSQPALNSIVPLRDAFYDAAEADLETSFAAARLALALALAGLVAILLVAGGVLVIVQRRVSGSLLTLTARMSSLAEGELDRAIPHVDRRDEIGDMARTLLVFRDAARDKIRMEEAAAQARIQAEQDRVRLQEETIRRERDLVTTSFGSGMERLAAKDLSFRLTATLPEAYAKLQSDFNTAMDALSAALLGVAESAETISGSTGEIASAATDLARRTEQQAATLEETAAAVDEITSAGRKAAEGAQHARSVVANAKSDAEKTGRVVRQAVAAIGDIEKSSAQMSQIIGVIDEIAFQTNLLALNAGVEAARAGEAGRGFAVVASEVRGLAQRSAEAAKEIKALITSSSDKVSQGVDLVAATGTALERILVQIDGINDIMVNIAAGADTQATGLAEVNGSINQIDQNTQQNVAMVQETTTASSALEQQSRQLTELIAAFRFSGAAGGLSHRRGSLRRVA